jgi:hypothetical protein
MTAEKRGLAIAKFDMFFPTHFMLTGDDSSPGPLEADILSELRTQRFLQVFLESLHDDLDWTPEEKVEELFQIHTLEETEGQLTDVIHRLSIRD